MIDRQLKYKIGDVFSQSNMFSGLGNFLLKIMWGRLIENKTPEILKNNAFQM